MMTSDLLLSITYNYPIKSHSSAFEYLFLHDQTIDIITERQVNNCNTMLAELHFLEKFLLNEDRQSDEWQIQADRAQRIVTAFTSAKFITKVQSQYLLHCIMMPDTHSFDLTEFCHISNVNPKLINTKNIEIYHYSDRTLAWKLTSHTQD